MKTKSYLYIITAAACWGLIGLFVRHLAAEGFSSLQIVALRSLVAAICITLLVARNPRRTLSIRPRDCWLFIGTGICSLVFFNFCYFNSMQQTNLAVAALLLYTAPIFVMLLSLICFGERFTRSKAIALVLTFTGCACVTGALGSGLTLSTSGLLYGLGSGFGYALYSIFGKYAVKRYSSLTITAYTFYFAVLGSWPLAGLQPASLGSLSSQAIFNVCALGILCAVLPYLLYTKGLEGVEAGRASILATIEPFVAATVGVLCFAEPLTLTKISGMALILAAIVVLNLERK